MFYSDSLYFDIIILISLVFFLYHVVIILAKQRVIFNSKSYLGRVQKKKINILVCARNEEGYIAACLTSLKKQTYKNFEVLVADDHSTDDTYKIMKATVKGDKRFKLYHVKTRNNHLNGKQNALNFLLTKATSDIILQTDADCTCHSDWATLLSAPFRLDKGGEVGMVIGVAYQPSTGFSSRIQRAMNIYTQAFSIGFVGLGFARFCIGNNLAFRLSCYNDLGGYSKLGHSLTEDAQLLQEIKHTLKKKIVAVAHEKAVVQTKKEENFRAHLRQLYRWVTGGIQVSSLSFSVQVALLILAIFVSFIAGVINLNPLPLILAFFLPFFMLNIHDNYFLTRTQRFDIVFPLVGAFYAVLAFYIIPVLIIIKRKHTWKDRDV